MKTLGVTTRISIKNIAFMTDLSPASYAALPVVTELGISHRRVAQPGLRLGAMERFRLLLTSRTAGRDMRNFECLN